MVKYKSFPRNIFKTNTILILSAIALLGTAANCATKETVFCAYYDHNGHCPDKQVLETTQFDYSSAQLRRDKTLEKYDLDVYFKGDTLGFVHTFGTSFDEAEMAGIRNRLKAHYILSLPDCGQKNRGKLKLKVERIDFYPDGDRISGLSPVGDILLEYHRYMNWAGKKFSEHTKLCPGRSDAPFALDIELNIQGPEIGPVRKKSRLVIKPVS